MKKCEECRAMNGEYDMRSAIASAAACAEWLNWISSKDSSPKPFSNEPFTRVRWLVILFWDKRDFTIKSDATPEEIILILLARGVAGSYVLLLQEENELLKPKRKEIDFCLQINSIRVELDYQEYEHLHYINE